MPELQRIARNYLAGLEKCLNDEIATADYDYIFIKEEQPNLETTDRDAYKN